MSNLPAQQTKGKSPAQPSNAETVRGALNKMMPQLSMALPKHLTAERLVRVTMTAIQNTPKLLECDRKSLFAAVMTSAQLGLEPDGILGQAYLIPFKVGGQMKVQFIPGYKGLLKLARNSGEVSNIQAQAVYEGDEFDFEFGLDEKLRHKPSQDGDRQERDITHFYAIAKFKDGSHYWDVMTKAQVEKVRDGSQGYQAAKRFAKNGKINSPWSDHFEEMGRKTVIRRISKYLPMDVQKAAFIADSYDTGRNTNIDMSGEYIVHGDNVMDGEAEEVKKVENKSSQLDDFADDESATIEIADHTGEITAVANIEAAKEGILAFIANAPVEKAKEAIINNNLDLINQMPKADADEIGKAATMNEQGEAAQ